MLANALLPCIKCIVPNGLILDIERM